MEAILDTPLDIALTLSAYAEGGAKSWQEIGILLHQIERSGYWRQSTASFTDWLSRYAHELRLQESSLWRYLTAVRYYDSLRKLLAQEPTASPEATLVADKLSAENIELLSKLERAMPHKVFVKLAREVLSGHATRSKLRETWRAYRPALAGKTARGNPNAAPRIDHQDPVQQVCVTEAMIFTALSSMGCSWLGIKSPFAYGFFMNVRPELSANEHTTVEFDAVSAVQTNPDSPLVLHGIGIEATSQLQDAVVSLKSKEQYCDYTWLAVQNLPTDLGADIPQSIGILKVQERQVTVIREATRRDASPLTGQLAKSLLATVLHR